MLDDLVLVSVGRLVYQKAHEVLVACMPDVLKEFPNAKAWIFGEGPLRADLQSQIERLGVSNSVKLPGRQSISRDTLQVRIFLFCRHVGRGCPLRCWKR
ncbi:MAG: glycosyltransferase [Anaerolineales bacterium]|nr:glycosyltransferase [Anaerolineales bacterium]